MNRHTNSLFSALLLPLLTTLHAAEAAAKMPGIILMLGD